MWKTRIIYFNIQSLTFVRESKTQSTLPANDLGKGNENSEKNPKQLEFKNRIQLANIRNSSLSQLRLLITLVPYTLTFWRTCTKLATTIKIRHHTNCYLYNITLHIAGFKIHHPRPLCDTLSKYLQKNTSKKVFKIMFHRCSSFQTAVWVAFVFSQVLQDHIMQHNSFNLNNTIAKPE